MGESQNTLVQNNKLHRSMIEPHCAQTSDSSQTTAELQRQPVAPTIYQPKIVLEQLMGRWQLQVRLPKYKQPVTGEALIWQNSPGTAQVILQCESLNIEHQLELNFSGQNYSLSSHPEGNDRPHLFRGFRISEQLIRFYPEIHSDKEPEHVELVQLAPNQWQITRYQLKQGQARRQQTFYFTRHPAIGSVLLF